MRIEAYAKVNLSLDITGIDERGYHLLSSVFSEISLSDTLTLTPGGEGISMTCSIADLPTDDRNLCVKAAKKFLDAFSCAERDFKIHLIKRIPSGAGLGGGSSDAAAVLKLLCRYFEIPKDSPQVQAVALSVGADVPFFLKGGCCLAEGVGEVLTPLTSVKDPFLVVAKDVESAPTPEVYRRYDQLNLTQSPQTTKLCQALSRGESAAPHLSNHLTAATAQICPSVLKLKEKMLSLGALGAEMTGSGSAVFGIFADEVAAQQAKKLMDVQFSEVCRFIK